MLGRQGAGQRALDALAYGRFRHLPLRHADLARRVARVAERLGILDKDPQSLMTSALKPGTNNVKWAADMQKAFPDLKAAEQELGRPIKTFADGREVGQARFLLLQRADVIVGGAPLISRRAWVKQSVIDRLVLHKVEIESQRRAPHQVDVFVGSRPAAFIGRLAFGLIDLFRFERGDRCNHKCRLSQFRIVSFFGTSPPRPEFDLKRARQASPHEVDDAMTAAQDFRIARHFGFEEQRIVINLGGHENCSCALLAFGNRLHSGSYRRDPAKEGEVRIGPRLERDRLSHPDVSNLAFRNRGFRLDRPQFVNLGNQVALLDQLMYQFL